VTVRVVQVHAGRKKKARHPVGRAARLRGHLVCVRGRVHLCALTLTVMIAVTVTSVQQELHPLPANKIEA
jgi:hypothetical protein